MTEPTSNSGDGDPLENDDLPPETLPLGCSVNIRGWDNENEDEARAFGANVLGTAKAMSRYLDLSNLESIVIGYDYREALASISGANPDHNIPTANEYGEGGAMAVTVVRDDHPWKVVVIWTPLVRQLVDETHEHHRLAMHTFWHELVHVDDLRYFATTFPGGWRAAQERNCLEGHLLRMTNPCESEYSAARRSAFWVPDYGCQYLDMLESALRDVDSQIREARIAYRLHGDMETLWPIVTERIRFLFQAMGYALGHVDGVANLEERDEALIEKFEAHLTRLGALPSGWIVGETRAAAQRLFDTNPWADLDVFAELNSLAERLVHQFRLYPRNHGDGLYIDAPYTSLADL